MGHEEKMAWGKEQLVKFRRLAKDMKESRSAYTAALKKGEQTVEMAAQSQAAEQAFKEFKPPAWVLYLDED